MRWPLIFLLLFLSSVTQAQKIRYNTQACTLSVNDKFKIQSVAEFEADYYADVFGTKRLPTVFVNVYGEKKKYKKKDPPPQSQGFCRSGSVYVLYSDRYLNTCYHECSHALFGVFAKHKPTWIDEGIAEYFEHAKVDSTGSVRIYAAKYRMDAMRSIVKSGRFKIGPLLGFSYRRFHLWRESKNYSLSWGIVNYLMTMHRETFGTILYRIGTGTESVKAINDEYTGGVPQLEKDIVEYYK
jgi:hypothetical protein